MTDNSLEKSEEKSEHEDDFDYPEDAGGDADDSGSGLPEEKRNFKLLAVAGLAFAVLVLAYYFFSPATGTFVPGTPVTPEEFKELFELNEKIYIVMDIRGISDNATRRNVLQCGVDFAGSSGMGGKQASYLSVDDNGCITPEGSFDYVSCFSQISDGITLYVHAGDGYSFHSNGMVVGVGSEYALGECGIHRPY